MASLGKVGMDEASLAMGNRLAAAMERLADELHTYNHPPVEVRESRCPPACSEMHTFAPPCELSVQRKS